MPLFRTALALTICLHRTLRASILVSMGRAARISSGPRSVRTTESRMVMDMKSQARRIRRRVVGLLFSVVGCASSSSAPDGGVAKSEAKVIPACSWPASAVTVKSGVRCQAESMAQICNVPPGSEIYPDGSIVTPDAASAAECKLPCAEAEYLLSCHASMDGGSPSDPSPDTALGCRAAGLPMPLGTMAFCCSCSQ
jgi:hypothetical protein